ncbi:MAG: hypothetical protein PHF24_04780 [Syntrophomonas sp.]|nr:hypothetical protein [Syntrophomonas sp.]
MNKVESYTELAIENCRSCTHFGFCAIYWGAKCKRQGGNQIPRMKTRPIGIVHKANYKDINKADRFKKQFIDIFEPIRTKRANWYNI